jgi:hypothetical protein
MTWARVFTYGMALFWASSLVWSWRRSKYLFFAFMIGTLFTYWSEFSMVRVGTYYYGELLYADGGANLPTWEPNPFLLQFVATLPPVTNPTKRGCEEDYPRRIPLGIMFMEGVLLLAFFRTSYLLGLKWYIAPFLDALACVNLDALLDPVVARTVYCSLAGTGPEFTGLTFWTWRSTEVNPGWFFGIPYVNYVAWFMAVWAFSMSYRLVAKWMGVDDVADPPPNPTPPSPGNFLADFPKAIIALIVLVLMLIVLVATIGFAFGRRPGDFAWQSSIMAAIMLVSAGVVVVWGRPFRRDADFVWQLCLPQLFVFAFCLAGLIHLWSTRSVLWPVAVVTTALGVFYAVAPYRRFWALIGFPPPGSMA